MIKFKPRQDFYKIPLEKESIMKYKSPDNMLIHAKADSGIFLIQNGTNKMIGYIGWSRKNNGQFWITCFEVAKEFQGMNYGTELLKYAVSKGCTRLSVNKKNWSAIQFYIRRGWDIYDETPQMYFMKLKNNKIIL